MLSLLAKRGASEAETVVGISAFQNVFPGGMLSSKAKEFISLYIEHSF
jgi:hypothetical protein